MKHPEPKHPGLIPVAGFLLLLPGGPLLAMEDDTPDPALLEFIGEFSEQDEDEWIDPTQLPALEAIAIEADEDGEENDHEKP